MSRARPVMTEIPSCAMAIYAHPDDPDISCGGTLARWASGGCEVHVVLCASGDKGSNVPDDDPAVVAARRIEETREATAILGIGGLHTLGRPDGELENDSATRAALVGLVRQIRPEIVVCPDPTAVFFGTHHYNHRDHRVVGWAVLDAVAPAAASPLYFPERGPSHHVSAVLMSGSLEPNIWVDISATIDAKISAVSCHKSQLVDANDWFVSAVRDGAGEVGRDASLRYAEAFRRIELG
jgi:LmbE family N-acetylglucosaminyl deacetylase